MQVRRNYQTDKQRTPAEVGGFGSRNSSGGGGLFRVLERAGPNYLGFKITWFQDGGCDFYEHRHWLCSVSFFLWIHVPRMM